MTHSITHHKGFTIQKRNDVPTHTAIIYMNGELIKCIAGDIDVYGNENAIEKSIKWINAHA